MNSFRYFVTLLSVAFLSLAAHAAVDVYGIWYELKTYGDPIVHEAVVINPRVGTRYGGNISIPSNIIYSGVSYSVTSIGESAFLGCSGLTSVTIPNSVTSIGSSAFLGCSGLTSVTIPNSVTSIGSSAFLGCYGLTSVTIGNSVTSIGESAFLGCSGLTSVTIGNSVTSIGRSAFSGCSGLTSVTIPNSATSIGESAFLGCYGLTSVTIGNSVTSIGESAFSGCSGLTSVTIGNSVTSIGESAFADCRVLTSATIPNSVTSIGRSAFSGCIRLTSVTIGNSVTSIGESAFLGCRGLISVTIGNSVTSIGESAFADCRVLTSATIPNSVTSIGRSAFSGCSGLTSAIIGNSVTSIGESAFYGCSGLTSVIIPNSVTEIASLAFSGCSGLTSMSIGNSVTSIGSSAFLGCSDLTSVTIPNSVTSIGRSAFSGCSGLTSVSIGNSVTSIGESAFQDCSGLTSVIIPNSVTTIGAEAFCFCNGLVKSAYPKTLNNPFPYGIAIAYDPAGAFAEKNFVYGPEKSSIRFAPYTLEGEYTIPNSVTEIGNNAFQGCSGLTSVIIPNSVTEIGNEAFAFCDSLVKSAYPNTLRNPFPYGIAIAYDPAGAFAEKNFVYGPKKSSILFAPYTLNGEYTIPNSVTTIGNNAFQGCSGLTSVTIPNSETSIENFAFGDCNSLKSIIMLADKAPLMDENAFKGLYETATVSFPKSALNSYLSSACSLFKYIKFTGSENLLTHYSDGVLDYTLIGADSVDKTNTAFVQKGEYGSLTSVTIPERFTADDSERYYVTGIGYAAFRNCNTLKEVNFHNKSGISSIGDVAFEGTLISNISLPASVTYIGKGTFKNSSLNSFTIPDSVVTIEDETFYECRELKSVDIPAGVISIGKSAFYGCSGLTSTIIGNSVTSIGFRAFEGCSSLKKSAYPNTLENPFGYGHVVAYNPEETIMEDGVMYDLEKSSILFVPHTFSGNYIIPNSITSVGVSAFAGCFNLSSIVFGNGIKTVADNAFAECGLSKVVLPPAVESIGNSAFAGSPSLKEVAIGPNVKSISDKAFDNTPLERVYITAPEPPVAPNSAFSRYIAKLYVQGAAVNAYYDAKSCWDRFEGYAMSEPESLTMEKPKSVEGKAGEQFTLKATLTPANVELPYVFWRSTDPAKAYVDNDGKVTVLQDLTAEDNVEIIAETLYYNSPTARFSFATDASGVDEIVGDTTSTIDVYTLQGVLVLRNATREQFENLSSGIYIIRSGKYVKKVVR